MDKSDYEAGEKFLLKALGIFEERGAKLEMSCTLCILGKLEHERAGDNYKKSRDFVESAIGMQRSLGTGTHLAHTLNIMGQITYENDDNLEAQLYFQESLTIQSGFEMDILKRNSGAIAHALEGLANLNIAQNNLESSLRLANAAAVIREHEKYIRLKKEENWIQRLCTKLAQTRRKLGEERSESIWIEARQLTLKNAILYGLEIANRDDAAV